MTPYFAFGSNMFQPQAKERFPHSFCLFNAKLAGYKFAIVVSDDPSCTASGYATVLPKEGAVTYGVLFALTPEDEKVLDKKEDVAKGDYVKMECTVEEANGHSVKALKALTYVNKLTREGDPREGHKVHFSWHGMTIPALLYQTRSANF